MNLQQALVSAFGLDAGSEFQVMVINLLRQQGIDYNNCTVSLPDKKQVKVQDSSSRNFVVIGIAGICPHVLGSGTARPPPPLEMGVNAL